MRSENMPKTRYIALSNRDSFSPFIKKIVVAEHDGDGSFRPEAELMLFMRMSTKNRQNIANMYPDREVIPLYRT